MNATPSYKRVHILVPRNISCHSGYTLWLQPVKYKKKNLKKLTVNAAPACCTAADWRWLWPRSQGRDKVAGGVGTARGGTLQAPRGHRSLQAAPFFTSGLNVGKMRGAGMGRGKEVSKMRLSPEKGAIFFFSPLGVCSTASFLCFSVY